MADRSIGLDIGSSAARAVQVRFTGSTPVVERFVQVALEPGWVRDGEILDRENVVQALKRLWRDGQFESKAVTVGFASPRTFVRELTLPGLADDEIASALRFEAQELIPVPMDDLVVDFEILSRVEAEGEDEGSTRVLLAAAPTESIAGYIDVARRAELSVVGVDLLPFAHVRALFGNRWDASPASESDQAEVIIGSGSTMTSVVIAERGVPLFVRVWSLAGDDVTSAVASDLDVSRDEAEGAKRRGGDDVAGVIRQQVPQIAEQIATSFDYYAAQPDTLSIGRVSMVGGGAHLEGLAEALHNRAGVPVEVAHPLKKATVSDLGLNPEVILKSEPLMAGALGVALAGATPPKGERRASLLPEGTRLDRDRRRQNVQVATFLGVFVLALAALWFVARLQVMSERNNADGIEQEAASVRGEVNKLSDVAAVQSDIEERRGLTKGVLAEEIDWLRLMRQVGAMTESGDGKDVSLTSFTGQAGQAGSPSSISLTANASDENAVANWLERGRKVNALSDLWVPSANRDESSGAFQFASTGTLTSGATSDRAVQLSGDSKEAGQ